MIKSEVYLQDPGHRYFDKYGREFLSVSKLLGHFKEKFDEETMSYMVAKKRAKEKHGDAVADALISAEKELVLGEWAKKRDDACVKGTNVHNALQTWIETTFMVEEYRALIVSVGKYLMAHPIKQAEVVLHTDKAGFAGTSDLLVYRTRGSGSVIDIVDYKTNVIERSSKYGKYLKGPLSHLEDCNYNFYALQLSLYAFMIELQFGRKVGNLTILEISDIEKGIITPHPVPYMRHDVRQLISYAEKAKIISFDAVSN